MYRKARKPAGVWSLLAVLIFAATGSKLRAQETPYFVTYSQALEEPGNLELETKNAVAKPDGASLFGATALEIEYGTRAWWTSELYLDGQTTAHDSTIFTGYRLENRFRPLMREHLVNPVLYVEYESISGADKALLEVVGHDGSADLVGPNSEARAERKHEGELKLILSSYFKDWNVSENFIAEKNLGHAPWEFGYAAGLAHALPGTTRTCWYCSPRFAAGAEVYGGLGDTHALTLRDTSHYIAPTLAWELPVNSRISFSPTFGITSSSLDRFYRFGLAVEMKQIAGAFRREEWRGR